VHGDDITSDADGNDCYRFVKEAGRFKVVKRTPGISTTDLVGRMLLCTRDHFMKSLENVLAGTEGAGSEIERKERGAQFKKRIEDYATDESGLHPGSEVFAWHADKPQIERKVTSDGKTRRRSSVYEKGSFHKMVPGKPPKKGQRVVYVDGGFDLFSSGHIEFLRSVCIIEQKLGEERDWYSEDAKKQRIQETGEDYGPAYVVAGLHDDEVINFWKGVNYPVMNIFERGLCVLQCKVSRLLVQVLITILTFHSTFKRSFSERHSSRPATF